MTEAELQRLETELELKLPAAYRALMLSFPTELKDWPPQADGKARDRRDDFSHDIEAILKVNKTARRKMRKRFPAGGFIFGGSPGEWWMIDGSSDDPPVQLIFRDDQFLDGFANVAELFEAGRTEHQNAWKKAGKRAKAGAAAKMDADTLVAAAREMARPAVVLEDEGKKTAAIWRGTGVVSPGPGEWRHWISIDASVLPDNPRKLTGVISLYEWRADDDRWGELKVVHDADAKLPRKTDGQRLYARKIDCLPPTDALLRFGPKPIQNWLKANSWDSKDGYNDTFPDPAPIKAYERLLMSEHPFALGETYAAMLGGWSWSFGWCYSIDEGLDWSLFKKALVVLTLRESEPWIEVYDDGKKFQCLSRIT